MSHYKPYPEYKDSGVEWLGEVPEGWEVKSLRHHLMAIFNGLTATQIDSGENTVPVTRIETISKGVIDTEKLGYINERDATPNRLLIPGDILFSNINSLNMIGNCAQYSGPEIIYAGMNLLVFRPIQSINSFWLLWMLKSPLFRQEVESRAKPAINQASISQGSILGISTVTPPISEQSSIASFLDRETARIDSLITKQTRLIGLFQEKRSALISHAVTKGLDPNVKMKDSGVEWLGEVPEGWETEKISRYFGAKKGINAQQLTKEYCSTIEGSFPVYSGQTENNGVMAYIDRYEFDVGEEGVLFSTTVGAKAMNVMHLKGKFSLSQNCMIILLMKNQLLPRFFFYHFQPLFTYERQFLGSVVKWRPTVPLLDLAV